MCVCVCVCVCMVPCCRFFTPKFGCAAPGAQPGTGGAGSPLHLRNDHLSEKEEVLLRGVGTLRRVSPHASGQWQPDGLTIYTKKWFLGAGFLGAPPMSLTLSLPLQSPPLGLWFPCSRLTASAECWNRTLDGSSPPLPSLR